VAAWVLWLIIAAVLAAGELLTLSLFLGPVAVAAAIAALVAGLGAGAEVQVAAFLVAAAASILVLRPIARRHLRTPSPLRTGTAALVGARAVVVQRVDAGGGQVKINGEVWSARPYDEESVIESGARVHVLEIRGATALVSD
jgi:membrane protein implicated in regulation of membrane protease activity